MCSSFYVTLIDPLLRDIRLFVPGFAGMKAGDRVLDVCCGTGDQVLHCAAGGIKAAGIDLNEGMVAQAEKSRIKRGFGNVSFSVQDAAALSFGDNMFDFISISLALHEKDSSLRDRVITEMKRVVKKDGVLVFVDFHVPLPRNLMAFFIRSVEFLARGEHYRNFKNFLSVGGLDELLQDNGLTSLKRDVLKSGTIAVVKAAKGR